MSNLKMYCDWYDTEAGSCIKPSNNEQADKGCPMAGSFDSTMGQLLGKPAIDLDAANTPKNNVGFQNN